MELDVHASLSMAPPLRNVLSLVMTLTFELLTSKSTQFIDILTHQNCKYGEIPESSLQNVIKIYQDTLKEALLDNQKT